MKAYQLVLGLVLAFFGMTVEDVAFAQTYSELADTQSLVDGSDPMFSAPGTHLPPSAIPVPGTPHNGLSSGGIHGSANDLSFGTAVTLGDFQFGGSVSSVNFEAPSYGVGIATEFWGVTTGVGYYHVGSTEDRGEDQLRWKVSVPWSAIFK